MVLLNLLSTKTPVTDADLIRSLACRALVGLSRHGMLCFTNVLHVSHCSQVRKSLSNYQLPLPIPLLCHLDRVQQIISKLPLFNNGQLQTLMREPVLHDKRLEHAKFCKYATELLERVTGTR